MLSVNVTKIKKYHPEQQEQKTCLLILDVLSDMICNRENEVMPSVFPGFLI